MRTITQWRLLLVCCAVIVGIAAPVAAQVDVTYEDYKIRLAETEQRMVEAKKSLADCKTVTDKLSSDIAAIDKQVAALKQRVYALVGSDEHGITDYLQTLDRIEARLMGLRNLPEDQLFDARDEVDQIEFRVKGLKADKRAYLPVAKNKLASIDQLLEQINARMPRKRIRQYSVLKGDSLWKISKKKEIYSDPYLWPRIYVENRNKIKNPDLIYPNWVLNVPFGVDLNHHLVMRGDNLSSIAGKVYKDVTQWNRIYQANKSQILDPSLIFPAQVLSIPAQ